MTEPSGVKSTFRHISREAIRDTLGELMPISRQTIVQQVPRMTRLRDLRIRAGMKQVELAERAGIARTTVVRLEQGDPNVSPSTVRKLARALRVKPGELFGDE